MPLTAKVEAQRFLSCPIFETLLCACGFEKSYKQIFIICYTDNTAAVDGASLASERQLCSKPGEASCVAIVEGIIVDAHTDDEPKRMLGNNIFIRNSDKYHLNTIFLK